MSVGIVIIRETDKRLPFSRLNITLLLTGTALSGVLMALLIGESMDLISCQKNKRILQTPFLCRLIYTASIIPALSVNGIVLAPSIILAILSLLDTPKSGIFTTPRQSSDRIITILFFCHKISTYY